MSITSFEKFPNRSLRSENETVRRQLAQRERALTWIKDPRHQVKRRVLRQHLSEKLEAPDLTEQAATVINSIGSVALGWQLNERSSDGPIAVCKLTNADDSYADKQIEDILNELPGVIKIDSSELQLRIRSYGLIIPNGDTTYDVITARRAEVPHYELGDRSIYSVSSEVIRT